MTENQQANEQHWKLLVLLLKNIAKTKGITQEKIAEETGLQQANISRIFSLKYCPTLQSFIAIARAVGVNFFFEDKDSNTDLSNDFNAAMEELGRRPGSLPMN